MQLTSYHTDDLLATIEILRAENADLRTRNQKLRWSAFLDMLNQAGLLEAINDLDPNQTYIIALCDVDHMKRINTVSGNHFQTNRYLKSGFQVRDGEIVGQLFGDEFLFILHDPLKQEGFADRIRQQLAEQPLSAEEQHALILAGSPPHLSATFSDFVSGVRPADMPQAIEWLSQDVLAKKAERDARKAAA